MLTLILGAEHEGALVVRITKSQSLFQATDGTVDQVDELYAELKTPDGSPDFVSLLSTTTKFTELKSEIKPLDSIWRPK